MSRCHVCQEHIKEALSFAHLLYRNVPQSSLCPQCRSKLLPVSREVNICKGCEKISAEPLCLDCVNWKKQYPDFLFKHRSLYYYNDFAKEYMQRYKVMGDCMLASTFAQEVRVFLNTHYKGSLVVPIPISQRSKQERGFNQVKLILDSAGIDYIDLLEHRGSGEKQARKNKSDRMTMTQPFSVRTGTESKLVDSSFVLVDDLYTTGRTMFYASEAVNSHSPGKLETFSLFR